jgi:hypothetical protein
MKKIVTAMATMALLAISSPAHAGQVSDSASCSKNPDGSGSCYGSYAGFRNTSGPGDYAEFVGGTNGASNDITFYASLAGSFYSCDVNLSTTPTWLLSGQMTGHSYFAVNWNSSGQCTNLTVINGSWTTTK